MPNELCRVAGPSAASQRSRGNPAATREGTSRGVSQRIRANPSNVTWIGFSLGWGARGNTLTGNTAIGNNIGFLLWGDKLGVATGNVLTGNRAERNALYGFEVANGASYNTLKTNTATGNGELDAFQQGDAGSGNRWVSNDSTRRRGSLRALADSRVATALGNGRGGPGP